MTHTGTPSTRLVPDSGAEMERISRLLAEMLNIDPPAPDTELLDSGLLDSLGFVELLAWVEEEFDVPMPLDDLDLDDLRTVRRIQHTLDRVRASRRS
jgi:acyl carrier protein